MTGLDQRGDRVESKRLFIVSLGTSPAGLRRGWRIVGPHKEGGREGRDRWVCGLETRKKKRSKKKGRSSGLAGRYC